MTNLIIWSKDRACQLHLLLESIQKFSSRTFSNVFIIYTYSNNEFKKGYDVLKARFPNFEFKFETSFKDDTITFLNRPADNIAFSTDDTVIFKSVTQDGIKLKPNEVFSLRLGLNTLIQDCYKGSVQPPLNRYSANGDEIAWNPLDYHPEHNYGYPGALDLHLFNREKICELVKTFQFNNTNGLETGFCGARHHFSSITSLRESVAVNIPCNNMSSITVSGKFHPYSVEDLNAQYLSGYVISLHNISQNKFVGCHQEVPFRMVRYE